MEICFNDCIFQNRLSLPLLWSPGTKGSICRSMPPEGEEANYTYPSVYPTPKSVSPVAAQGELLKASPDWTDEGQVDSSRSKTKTYGPKLPQ